MNYRQRMEKEITLPSGSKVTIEKLNAFNKPFIDKRASEDQHAYGVGLATFILCNKTGLIDGQFRVVPSDKVTDREKEISVEQLDQKDADYIVNEVMEFSGFGARDQEARKTFPEKPSQQEDNHSGASVGASLPGSPSNGTPCLAAL